MTNKEVDYLNRVAINWESLAKSDPLWAILSNPDKKGNKWDINDFLQTGVREIDALMGYIKNFQNMVNRHLALDFGCGVGRLTLPLAKYFDNVVGLDISDTMISLAKDIAQKSSENAKGKIQFVLNKSNIIPFENDTFDLIYSIIVLQHLNKYNALLYISEFVRVLKKNGIAVFQAPSRCLTTTGNRFESPVETHDGTVTIDMNLIPIGLVIEAVYDAGGKMLEIRKDQAATDVFESFKYCISK